MTALGSNDAVVAGPTDLTLAAGSEQTISLAGVSPAANQRLKVKFDMTSSGSEPRSTPLVKQLQVTYAAAKAGSDQDGDGVADASDGCPTAAGPAAAGGCPDADGDASPMPGTHVRASPVRARRPAAPTPTATA